MSHKVTWQSLLTTALVGTDRQSFDAAASHGALGESLSRLSTAAQKPSTLLLNAAAALAVYKRAGSLPSGDLLPAFDPCPAETLSACSNRAETFLTIMLNGDYSEVLLEYLGGVASSGRRVSEVFLPALLDIGRRRSDIRPLLVTGGGERLRWLAAQNDDWGYANVGGTAQNDDDLESAWETGSKAARLAILTSVRAKDAARGHELVEKSWKQEAAADRAAFVAGLETGLSMDDEPFLDGALADRSVEVGRAAADILSRLPLSNYSLRMAERARASVRFKRRLLGGWNVEVILPEKFDDELKADRLEEKSGNRLLGERAWLLCQIVGAAPLSIWQTSDFPPLADLIASAEKSEWANALITGWSIALKRHPDASWLTELARHWLGRTEQTAHVLEYLPPLELFPDVTENLITEFLLSEKQPLYDKHPAFVLLSVYRLRWSVDLSRAVLISLIDRLSVTGANNADLYQLHSSLGQFALRMPGEMAPEATAVFTPNVAAGIAGWTNAIDKFVQTLQFRYDMLQAIRQEQDPLRSA